MILMAHPTGNSNVRHAALALHRDGLLGEFWTCLNYRDRGWLRRVLPGSLRGQLRRRACPDELHPKIRTFSCREALRLLAPRLGLGFLARHETGPVSVDAVYRSLDRQVARRLEDERFSAVYAYEDGAEDSFRAAARLGRIAFYDLPIGYWRAARAILGEEAELQPAWAPTLTGNRDSAAKTDRKDAELALADVVLVASSFTRRTLEFAPSFRAAVVLAPYGAPPPLPVATQPREPGHLLRVLYVGSLGQRKGLSYLFEACRQVDGLLQLTVIGARPSVDCPALDRELATVRWLPGCPHAQVLKEMAAHDVFVLPSLFEGFGLVLLEAMAMGLPIITTPHTAGPDLIEDGKEGFIVPIRDPAAIAARLELLHDEPERLQEMSRQARLCARRFTWENYQARLAACARTALDHPPAAPACATAPSS